MVNEQNKNIYIGSSYRIDQDTYKISNEMIHPIRCGACFDKYNRNRLLGDDTGINISEKRNSYCELTVQYWMWKNIQAEYYGLCHYRRMLSFSDIDYKENKRNQVIEEYLNEETSKKYVLDSIDEMEDKITPYDIISAKPYDVRKKESPKGFKNSVREFWKAHDNVLIYEKDIDILEELIREYEPDYYDDAKEYLDGYMFLGYNCFIMKRELFNELCEYEFSILEAFEQRVDMSDYQAQMIRTPGFLGEILYSIFVYHKGKQGSYKISERQLVFFKDTETAYLSEKIHNEKRKPIVLVIDTLNPYTWNQCILSLLRTMNTNQLYYFHIFYRFLPDSLRNEWEEWLDKHKVYYKFTNLNLIDFGEEKQYIRHLNIEVYLPWYMTYLNEAVLVSKPCIFSLDSCSQEFEKIKNSDKVCFAYGIKNQIVCLDLDEIRKKMDLDELYDKIPNNSITWDRLLSDRQMEYRMLDDCTLIQESKRFAKDFYQLRVVDRLNLMYPKGSKIRNGITKIFTKDSVVGRIFKM